LAGRGARPGPAEVRGTATKRNIKIPNIAARAWHGVWQVVQ
jgi:hypothetical protein